jgi:hypothetical protein
MLKQMALRRAGSQYKKTQDQYEPNDPFITAYLDEYCIGKSNWHRTMHPICTTCKLNTLSYMLMCYYREENAYLRIVIGGVGPRAVKLREKVKEKLDSKLLCRLSIYH